jgi:pyruvate dehydrogenase E2 component (dihydrolipoamide acetyltransferase)
MAEIVRMPKLSDTMTEGVVSKWLKKVGDKVKSGDILAEIDSDKATMEFESFYDGVLLHIGVKEKEGAPVDSILAIIGEKGEDVSAILEKEKSSKKESPKEESKTEAPKKEETQKARLRFKPPKKNQALPIPMEG